MSFQFVYRHFDYQRYLTLSLKQSGTLIIYLFYYYYYVFIIIFLLDALILQKSQNY
jgi:hypothetical protein